jgi:transposase
MVVPPVDHDCVLKDLVEDLANRLAKLEHENAQLKKAVLGSRSEKSKMPRIKTGDPATPEDRQKTRRERAAAKAQAPTVRVDHRVPDAERRCIVCGNAKLDPLGDGKSTTVWEFVPARFVRVEHVQEVLRCRCNGFVVTAPGAPKVVEKGQYGASFLAHLAVSKCADHTPICRLEKAFARQGIPVARSTMNELLHRASAMLTPVWTRLLDVVRVRHVVQADETRLRIVRDKAGKTKNGFVWTFGARDDEGELDVAYVFAEDRSGSTPKTLLEGTTGVLLVDGYSGYNVVDEVSTRRRAACHAHLRRYFHEALPTAPVAAADARSRRGAVHRRARGRLAGVRWRPKVGVSETAGRPGPCPDEGLARCAARSASAQEPHRRRNPLRRQPVGRAGRLSRRRARAPRQQRLRARAPPRRARQEKLPFRL